MVYVFDASFIVNLIIPDERDPKTKVLYNKINDDDERHAPQLLWYEISNLFNNLIYQKCFTSEEVSLFLTLISAFRIKTDFESGPGYSQKLLNLGSNYNLSAYDAAYLELAERKNAVLCTLDENLIMAAKQHGVKIILEDRKRK